MIWAGWLYWIAYQVIGLALMVIGWVLLIPFAALKLWYTIPSRNPMFADRAITAWRGGWLTLLWGNDENGVAPPPATRWSSYVWTAWRNPANNMRLLPGASFFIDSANLKIVSNSVGYVATCGWRQCIVYRGVRFGWLIPPDAATGWRAWPVVGRA